MKKLLCVLLVMMTVFACFAGGSKEADSSKENPVQIALDDAAKMSWDELLTKAKAEIGDNEFQVYAVSTRLDTDAFTKATGIKTKATVLSDSDLVTKVETEIGNGVYGADVVLVSDAYEMSNLIEEGYVLNFVPDRYKTVLAEGDRNPLSVQYVNIVFFYNNDHGKLKNYLNNMWQLADPKYKGILMQSPLVASYMFGWVIEMTKPEWDAKIRTAYKNYYGKEWQKSEKFEYPVYEWFYGLIQNGQFEAKGGTIYNNTISGKPGTIGCVAFSKWREGDIGTLTVASVEGIDGIGGILTPTSIETASNAKYPYTAALFINYLLSDEGYSQYYGKDPGGYSSNPSIPISDTAKSRGDMSIDFWKKSMPSVDPVYISSKYSSVYTMISQWVAEKK